MEKHSETNGVCGDQDHLEKEKKQNDYERYWIGFSWWEQGKALNSYLSRSTEMIWD